MRHHLSFRTLSFLKHTYRTIISRRGYGIHSPFVFDLITNTLHPESPSFYYCFDNIEKLRYQLLNNNSSLANSSRTVKSIAKTSSTPATDGQNIFKLALKMKSKNMIELGTNLGLGTAYMASSNLQAQIISIDHNKEFINIAKENMNALKLDNIQFINNDFSEALPKALKALNTVDLMFFDGNHKGKATLDYFNLAKVHAHSNSVFIFHDIHWSKDMNLAWEKICQDQQVSISIEHYNFGLVFFNPEHHKQHFYA